MEPPTPNMKTSHLVIHSNGTCFLCSKQTAPAKLNHESEEPRPSKRIAHSIQSLSEFLELDIGTVLKNVKTSIPPWLLDQLKLARLEVELCRKCIALNKMFLEKVGQLENNEVELKSCLTLIQWRLSDARRNDTTDHENGKSYDASFVSSTGSKFKLQLGILRILRWRGFLNCSRKLNISLPRVKLQKLSDKEVNEISLQLKSWSPSDTGASRPTDNDCIDLPERDRDVIHPRNDSDSSHSNDSAKSLLDDKNNYCPSDDDLSWLSDSDKGEPIDNDDDYHPENDRLRDKRSNIKVNRKATNQTGGASKVNRDGKYSNPIIIYVSKSKSAEHAETSFKTFITRTGKYKCRLCPKEYVGANAVSDHFKSVHLEIRYKCPDANCGKLFCYRRNFHRHVETSHLQIRYECPFCKENVTKDRLYVHRRIKNKRGICPSKKAENELRRKHSDDDKDVPHADDNCLAENEDNDFSDCDQDGNMDKHVSGENIEEENAAQPSICIPSTSKAEESKDLLRPANQRKNQRAKTVRNGSQNQNPTRKTSILNKSGNYAPPIIVHGSSSKSQSAKYAKKSFKKYIFNHETRKYKCSLCPKEFTKPFDIISHFQSIHLQIRFKCPDTNCGKSFFYQRGYYRHVQFNHLKIRHQCPFCKEMVHSDTLYLHRKNKEKVGACRLRPLKMGSTRKLSENFNKCRASDKPVPSTSKEDFKEESHPTNQPRNRRPKITRKGNRAGAASRLNKNKNNFTPIIVYGAKSAEYAKKSFKRCIFIPETGNYKCGACPKEYKWDNQIFTHFRSVHLEIRYKCPVANCEKIFSSRRGLVYHRESHMNIRGKCPFCKEIVTKRMLYIHKKKNGESGSCPSRTWLQDNRPRKLPDNNICDVEQNDNSNIHLSGVNEDKIQPQPLPITPSTLEKKFENRNPIKRGKAQRANINRSGNKNQPGASDLPRNGRYSAPIIIYVSKSESEDHAKTSFKKWILIPETGKYKCRICPKECNSSFQVFLHFNRAHLEAHYKCPDAKCGKIFSSEERYSNHAKTHYLETRYECPYCKEKVKRGMLYYHKNKIAEGGSCPTRLGQKLGPDQELPENDESRLCDDNQESKAHNDLSGMTENENTPQLPISIPSTLKERVKIRRTAKQTRSHGVKMNRNGKQNRRMGASRQNKNITYPTPVVIYGSKSAKNSSKKWTFIPKTNTYKCNRCPKSYDGPACHISSHFKSVHLQRRYKCRESKCGKSFSYLKGYKRHVEIHHLKIRHECPFCKKNVTSEMLYMHRKRNAEGRVCPPLKPQSNRRRKHGSIHSEPDIKLNDNDDMVKNPENESDSGGDNSDDDPNGNNTDNLSGEQPTISVPKTLKKKLKGSMLPTNQRRSLRAKANISKNCNQKGRGSKLARSGNYPSPITIYGSKSDKYGDRSVKKWSFIRKTGKYKCSLCPKMSNGIGQISFHFKSVHLGIRYKCPTANCGNIFTSQVAYNRHAESEHLQIRYECPFCKEMVTKGMLYHHKKKYENMGICLLRIQNK